METGWKPDLRIRQCQLPGPTDGCGFHGDQHQAHASPNRERDAKRKEIHFDHFLALAIAGDIQERGEQRADASKFQNWNKNLIRSCAGITTAALQAEADWNIHAARLKISPTHLKRGKWVGAF